MKQSFNLILLSLVTFAFSYSLLAQEAEGGHFTPPNPSELKLARQGFSVAHEEWLKRSPKIDELRGMKPEKALKALDSAKKTYADLQDRRTKYYAQLRNELAAIDQVAASTMSVPYDSPQAKEHAKQEIKQLNDAKADVAIQLNQPDVSQASRASLQQEQANLDRLLQNVSQVAANSDQASTLANESAAAARDLHQQTRELINSLDSIETENARLDQLTVSEFSNYEAIVKKAKATSPKQGDQPPHPPKSPEGGSATQGHQAPIVRITSLPQPPAVKPASNTQPFSGLIGTWKFDNVRNENPSDQQLVHKCTLSISADRSGEYSCTYPNSPADNDTILIHFREVLSLGDGKHFSASWTKDGFSGTLSFTLNGANLEVNWRVDSDGYFFINQSDELFFTRTKP